MQGLTTGDMIALWSLVFAMVCVGLLLIISLAVGDRPKATDPHWLDIHKLRVKIRRLLRRLRRLERADYRDRYAGIDPAILTKIRLRG